LGASATLVTNDHESGTSRAEAQRVTVTVTALLNGVAVPIELDDAAIAALAAALPAPPPQETPVWLTVVQAAEYLGLTSHAVRKLIERGRLPKHQPVPGGRILLRRDEADAYLNDQAFSERAEVGLRG
jgi:excisionase family DNA binding protein